LGAKPARRAGIKMNFYEAAALVVADAAFILSIIIAYTQIKMHVQEQRPFLSFGGVSEVPRVVYETKTVGVDFYIRLKNVGRCVLYYEVTCFDVFVGGVKQPCAGDANISCVIGVNGESSPDKFFDNLIPFEEEKSGRYQTPDYKIVFSAEYRKSNKAGKKYKIFYEIDAAFERGIKKEIYVKSFAE
jgi:hypothetical protein